jgi:toxin FitB
MYLLDTNVILELRRARPHGAVLAWLDTVSGDQLFIPSVVVGEIQIGIERTLESNPEKAAALALWLDSLLQTSQFLDLGPDVFRTWARLIVRSTPDMFVDALIAASAIHHNKIVVTRNVRDFERFPVKVLNPFAYSVD